MTIGQYCSETRRSINRLAADFGLNAMTLARYIHGTSLPRVDVAVRIERATHGAVRCEDWTLDADSTS